MPIAYSRRDRQTHKAGCSGDSPMSHSSIENARHENREREREEGWGCRERRRMAQSVCANG